MSQSDTGAAQLRRLRLAGLRTRVLPVLTDVDRVDDAVAVARAAAGTPFAAAVGSLGVTSRPRTASAALVASTVG